jgi:LmbE family N-acetylglucosaminyl deacetylase
VELLNSRFDEFNPNIIFTHWPLDTRKSHQNAGLSTIAAARYFRSLIVFEPFPPGGRSYVGFRPQLYINVSDHNDKKLAALRAHRSQYDRYGKEIWINAVEARAQFRGFDLIGQVTKGKTFAEVFEIIRLNIEFFD